MSYSGMAQLELKNALNYVNSELELSKFKDYVTHCFAMKVQNEINALWDEGIIGGETIEQ